MPHGALGWGAMGLRADKLSDAMKRTWKLTPDQKVRIAFRYRRGERVKAIAADYRISTTWTSRVAWSRGAERRDKVHVRTASHSMGI